MSTKTVYVSADEEYVTELITHTNYANQIYIEIYKSGDQDNMYYIVLDKQTAIRLVKDIKRQISFLKDEVSND
jgi:hypothetical protein